VEHIVRESIYPQAASPIPRLRLSPFLLIVVITLVGFAVVTISASLVAQYRPTPHNPFPAYADVFPGQPASAVEARAFSCQNYAPAETSCIFTPAAGAFLSVQAVMSEDKIHDLTFVLRDNTLQVGDLEMFLKMPTLHTLYRAAYFYLPGSFVRVRTAAYSGQFSLFLPILSISFTKLS
jgi:hypothetical protein